AHGTLTLAGATFETEVEDVVDLFVAKARLAEPARHRQPQRIGAAARRVFFLSRRHVRRAHRSVERFSTGAQPTAHLHRTSHAAVLGEIEVRRRLRRPVAYAVSEVRG